MMRRVLPLLAAVGIILLPLTALSACAEGPRPVEISSVPITHFRFGFGDKRFGKLEFVGGLQLRSRDGVFGQLSAMRFLTPGRDFVGVADHGYWFFGSVERDAQGRPIAVRDFRMQEIVGADGLPLADKIHKDAEGLDLHEGVATVAFERNARVSEYVLDPSGMSGPVGDLDFLVPRSELRHNQGFEALARAPVTSALAGGRVVIAERSVDTNGDIFAAILEGPEKGIFKVRRSENFDVTDAAFLPDGDLLLLERRFSLAQGIAMRLRRIPAASLRRGALIDGEVLMEADLGHQIDNMEGLDVWRRDDGALIVSLLSDNNQSFLQRTLYLEFVLVED